MLIAFVVVIVRNGNTTTSNTAQQVTIEEKSAISVASSAEPGVSAKGATTGVAGIFKRVTDINKAVANGEQLENTESASVGSELTEDGAMSASAAKMEVAAKYPDWVKKITANVDSNMNIRSGPSTDYEVVGLFRRGDVGDIVDYEDHWYHITTGSVDGYVIEDYVLTGDEAREFCDSMTGVYATTTVTGLRVRSGPSTDSEKIRELELGDKLVVDEDAEPVDGWVCVKVKDQKAYVSAEYVNVARAYTSGVTLKEAAEIEAEKQKQILMEKAKAAAEKAVLENNEILKAPYPATDYELRLMAAIIQSEAGGEPYYGQVAVGAVIMNRVRSGIFPNNITDVCYQPSQFYTARVNSLINNPQQSCINAALEAIGGRDNVDGRIGFMRASHGHRGIIIGHHVFFYASEW